MTEKHAVTTIAWYLDQRSFLLQEKKQFPKTNFYSPECEKKPIYIVLFGSTLKIKIKISSH